MAKHSNKLTKSSKTKPKQSKGPGLNKVRAHIKKAKTKKKLKQSRKGFPDTRASVSSSSNSFKFKKKKAKVADISEKIEDLDNKKDKSAENVDTKKTIAAPASSRTRETHKKHEEKHKSSKAKKSNEVKENTRINEKKDIKLSSKHKIRKRKISEGSSKDKTAGAKSKKTTAADIETVRVETSAKVPHLSAEVSANWKNLLKILPKSSKTKRPSKNDAQQASQKKNENSKQKAPEVWFDDVDEILLERPGEAEEVTDTNNPLIKDHSFEGLTKVVAIDCEMVGVGTDGEDSVLARVSVVNQHGHCVYDKHVKPTEKVTDYRTRFSGVRKEDLENAEDFKMVQDEVNRIIQGRILVGHAIHNDLKVLFLDHPKKKIRDTSRYKPFRVLMKGGTPSLKKLSEKVLAVKVQEGEHNSIQDAQAAMRLYTMYRMQWEKDLKQGKKVSTAYKIDWEKSQKFLKCKKRLKNKSKDKSQ